MKLIDFPERRPDAWLRALSEEAPDRPFLIFPDEGVTLTFRQAWHTGLVHSRFLQERAGLAPGDHLGLMLPNCSAWTKVWLGSILGGTVDVGLHHELGGQLLSHQLASAHVKAVLCDEVTAKRLAELKTAQAALPLHTLVVAGEFADTLPTLVEKAGLRFLPLTMANGGEEAEPVALAPQNLMSIRFTSGTTGPAKAGALTVSQVAVWADYLVQLLGFKDDDRIYAPFPLHHHLASVMGVLGALRAGGGCVVATQFSARKFWSTCVAEQATLGLILDPVVNILLKTPPAPVDRQHTVRAFYIARPNPAFEARFACRLQTAYALTEANVLTFMPEGDSNSEPTCVGRVNPHYEVRVFDETDHTVADGTQGEIVFRPRHPYTTMSAYYANAEATVKATRNLWFHTGDLGQFDTNGFLHFYERMGDTIRRRGVNIPAFHLEEVSMGYPGLEEAVAVAVPASVGEFEVKLCVVLQPGAQLDAEALIRWLCDRLPLEMVPRYLEVKRDLPRTITQKIIKRELKAEGITPATISTDAWIGNRTAQNKQPADSSHVE
jgi:crotonobetaine/carnitine-CoA ligase